MGKAKVKVDYKEVGKLLRGQESKSMMEHFGKQAAAKAGSGYGYRVHDSGQRQIANVFPNTSEAARDNLENNTLLKAVK